MLKLYHYPKCSTCRDALKLLGAMKIEPESIDISKQPPTKNELLTMLKHQDGKLRTLFNTSGIQYRELNLKDKLPNMSETEALTLLSKNGMLVKRPFLLGKDFGLVGFKEEVWRKTLHAQRG